MKKILLILIIFSACSLQQTEINKPEAINELSTIDFAMEIPVDSNHKYEFREPSGSLILDRVVCERNVAGTQESVSAFPASYGISPSRYNIDGDPLDLLVIGAKEFYQANQGNSKVAIRKVRPVGLVKMYECDKTPCETDSEWEQDFKVLAVDIADPNYNKVLDLSQINSVLLDKIKTFFGNYKGRDSKGYPKTKVSEISGVGSAETFLKQFPVIAKTHKKKFISECNRKYQTFLEQLRTSTLEANPDPELLECFKQVWLHPMMKASDYNDLFFKYTAYQFLQVVIGDQNATLDNSLRLMLDRRAAQKKYYRFVRHDSPAPGTGDPIFEWVKTVARDHGCAKDIGMQHYQKLDLLGE